MFAEKAPYIVTVIVAGLAWTLTHVVDRLLATPMLRYQSQEIQKDGKKSAYLSLKNITRDKTFRKLRVVVSASADGVLTEAQIFPIQPAWEGDQPFQLVSGTFDFTFPEIQPGWQFEISVGFEGKSMPTLRLSLDKESLYAVRPSLETFLVENDLELLLTLLCIWIVLLVVLSLIALYRQKASARGDHYDT